MKESPETMKRIHPPELPDLSSVLDQNAFWTDSLLYGSGSVHRTVLLAKPGIAQLHELGQDQVKRM